MGQLIRMDERQAAPAVEPLWREVVGKRLRERRHTRGDTLADTAARAGIAPQYLSEIERGRKDPSSEILAAVVGALGTSMAQISGLAHHDLSRGDATLMAA
ncbi:MAG: helix-turn-helix transcriptional regulator [Rhodococcus sp. (in: high G+C Gram-positive bacteria)]|uniref:helix-turn-helix domain-containing protein n=1 Tax=Rhodococcus sp. TaxID=1831 RepID=UPI002ADC9B79|nr:helix-turn-helix transcriptional regulator [Rhodococcus sp. (in: high G+C Gram-positive bacteria)]